MSAPEDRSRRRSTSFEGIARRQEVRGEGARHHGDRRLRPSSDRDSRNACARCAIVIRGSGSGRSSSRARTPRAAPSSSSELPEALKLADGVFIAQVARLEQIPEDERLNPEAVVAAIAAAGRPAFYEPDADAIVERLMPLLQPNDVVTIFSNGGFDGIHEKLLAKLAAL